jgi:hypothetical protein
MRPSTLSHDAIEIPAQHHSAARGFLLGRLPSFARRELVALRLDGGSYALPMRASGLPSSGKHCEDVIHRRLITSQWDTTDCEEL